MFKFNHLTDQSLFIRTHLVRSSLIDLFLLGVTKNLKGPYCEEREFRKKCTSTTWISQTLVTRLSSHVSHLNNMLVHSLGANNFIDDNFVIKVLGSALSEDPNCASITFIKSLTLSHLGIDSQLLVAIRDLINIMLKRLELFQR